MKAIHLVPAVFLACSTTIVPPSDGGTALPDGSPAIDATSTADAMDVAIDTGWDSGDAGIVLGCDGSYPPGPYGLEAGVITNLAYVGKTDTNMNGSVVDDGFTTLCLAEYFQNPKIQAIAIIASSMWCVPCRDEEVGLATLYNAYQANGGHVAMMEVLVDGPSAGTPATMQNLVTWTNQYKMPFDCVRNDLTQSIFDYDWQQAYPMHMVIDAKTMTIAWEDVGNQVDILEVQIDKVLGIAPPDAGAD